MHNIFYQIFIFFIIKELCFFIIYIFFNDCTGSKLAGGVSFIQISHTSQ